MTINARSKFIAVKKEVTYGVDVTPAATDAVQTSNLTITPFAGNLVSMDIDTTALGNSPQFNVNPHVQCSFDVYIQNSGTAGTAPAWEALLEACRFDSTNGASDHVFTPNSDPSPDSVTIYYYVGAGSQQQLHAVTGARGTVSFSMGVGGLPKMSFSFIGIRQTVIDTGGSPVTGDISDYVNPEAVNFTNTTTYTIDGFTIAGGMVAEGMTLDMNNELIFRNVIGQAQAICNDRAPTATFAIEAPDLTTKNFFSKMVAGTTFAANVKHGTAAGKYTDFSYPKLQCNTIDFSDSDGALIYTLNCVVLPNSGNDEVTITLT